MRGRRAKSRCSCACRRRCVAGGSRQLCVSESSVPRSQLASVDCAHEARCVTCAAGASDQSLPLPPAAAMPLAPLNADDPGAETLSFDHLAKGLMRVWLAEANSALRSLGSAATAWAARAGVQPTALNCGQLGWMSAASTPSRCGRLVAARDVRARTSSGILPTAARPRAPATAARPNQPDAAPSWKLRAPFTEYQAIWRAPEAQSLGPCLDWFGRR